jgi:hypothetical protein
MSYCDGSVATKLGTMPTSDVVEIGLLLPVAWADALMRMSKRDGRSVGTILRNMIDRALIDDLDSES